MYLLVTFNLVRNLLNILVGYRSKIKGGGMTVT